MIGIIDMLFLIDVDNNGFYVGSERYVVVVVVFWSWILR